MKILSRLLVALLFAIVPFIQTGSAAPQSATIDVNTTVDEFSAGGNCSLREAIISVNTSTYTYGCTLSGSGDVTINVPAGVFTLTRTGTEVLIVGEYGDLDILANMTINGYGIYDTFIDGNGSDRVFDVQGGHATSVTINTLTIRHGNSGDSAGGGIRNNANLTLNGVTVEDNHSGDYGGGIFHKHGFPPASPPLEGTLHPDAPDAILTGAVLTLTYCDIVGNTATKRGGGIANMEESEFLIQDSVVYNNTAGTDGGGIYNSSIKPLRVIRSRVTHNTAETGSGGGIYSGVSGGDDVQIMNSTFASNSAAVSGGGIYHLYEEGILELSRSTLEYNSASYGGGLLSAQGITTVENVTFSHNTAGGGSNQGGAIYIHSGSVEIVHATIAENTAESGAGIYSAGTGSIKSTIIANNRSSGGSLVNCIGALTSRI